MRIRKIYLRGAYHLIALRIMVASLYHCNFAARLHQPWKLCFVRCSVHLFVAFQKNIQANQSVFESQPPPFPPKAIRMKIWIPDFSLRTFLLRWKMEGEA